MKKFLLVFIVFLVGCGSTVKFNNYPTTEQPCKWVVDENENYYELCR